ncbi:hypothetical protein JMJ77_0011461 [Colletotrichum scovillei]|uniref:Uncharacterized protein n=1 Tax=Colletotrichum scovillei TaxID=1209932 RepID=A0A9P7U7L4_9PEZI|nr:hypothetical protein JMJ78_0008153 [Colletotrichum scovillei]KAG7040599.1 hypothetical protein JMJ77_0011461 [Colletotrichum scovillei]KAG7060648.1 hypothetical protein JMJ76_0012219 [Colletotrichum scovillei]
MRRTQHAYPGDSIMTVTFLAPHNPSHDPSLSPWARSWLSTCKAFEYWGGWQSAQTTQRLRLRN